MSNQQDSKTEGPSAPKDPAERRSSFYLMFESEVEATAREGSRPSQEIYLADGRLKNKAMLEGGVTDEAILNLLESCSGFHKLVHSIGVSVKTEHGDTGTVHFALQHWGKEDMYNTGSKLRIPCLGDGTETMIKLEDYEWSADDNVPGKIAFEFDKAGDMAVATVKLYLQDGYEVPEREVESPVAFDSAAYQEMIAGSLMSVGNTVRMQAAINKAKRGEEVTIAFIGGSITQGAGAKPIHTGCYPYKTYERFKNRFGKEGGENVQFVKAGVGGTPSELGMIRYERDVLKDGAVKPDIVVVEFAVNDAGDETKGNCYESLVLKILSGDNNPAVVLLFSVFANDWNLQDRLSPVGKHYDLPMVSVKDAVVDQFRLTKSEGNIISKRQYFYDVYHPTNDGHTIMADCLAHLFDEIQRSTGDAEDIVIDKAPVIGNSFKAVRLLDRESNRAVSEIAEGGFKEIDSELQMVEMDDNPYTSPEFPHNWMRTAASGNESFQMTIKSSSLVLVYKDSGSGEFGKADIFVDGQYVKTADPHQNNWTHCNPVILYQNESCEEHRVEIKMSAEDAGKCFTILGFGYTL